MRQVAARLASAALDLLYPGRCLLCGSALPPTCAAEPPGTVRVGPFAPVCRTCLESLRPLAGRRCARCSALLVSERSVCTRCRKRDYRFTANLSVFAYRDEIRELLYQYKFRQRRRAALVIAAFLASAWAANFPALPAVPVPGRRALDHLETVCRIMEKRHGVPVIRLLWRTGKVPQKSLDYTQRCRNIRGSIAWRGDGSAAPGAVVLVDDVFTSGATADECARVLRLGGVDRVQVLTFALD